jgi:hypothetical protein
MGHGRSGHHVAVLKGDLDLAAARMMIECVVVHPTGLALQILHEEDRFHTHRRHRQPLGRRRVQRRTEVQVRSTSVTASPYFSRAVIGFWS